MTKPHQPPKPVLDKAAQDFINLLVAQKAKPPHEVPLEEARSMLVAAQSGDTTKLPVDVEERTIAGGPSGDLSLRIVRPKGAVGPLPATMYFHGGGWVLGDEVTHDRLVREIAHGANTAVVFVDYSRSPEVRYPVAFDECLFATDWVAEHGAEINVDPKRLAVAGDSAGGCLAAAVAIAAIAKKKTKLLAQILFYPVTDANFDTSSYDQFAEGYVLSRDAMKWFWNEYAPNEADRKKSSCAPLRANDDELLGLPPAFVAVAEADVLRDEGEAFARRLVAAGVDVTAFRALGIIHDFVMLDVLSTTSAARLAIGQACVALRNAFTH